MLRVMLCKLLPCFDLGSFESPEQRCRVRSYLLPCLIFLRLYRTCMLGIIIWFRSRLGAH